MFGRRILILVPHPDDEVAGCCAAIGRARRQGAEVAAVYLTTGIPAAAVLWPWQRSGHSARVARRRAEAGRAAELLQIQPVSFAEISTRELKAHMAATLDMLRGHIRRLRPDVLWTPAYEGGHQDHDVTNFLASRLRAETGVWEFSEYNFAGGKVRSQQFIRETGGEQRIALSSEEQALKRRALQLYASEKGNLGYVRTEAEVFRPLGTYDYRRPPHAGKLFYQRFQWVPYHPRVDYTHPQQVCQAIAAFDAEPRGAE